MDHDEFRWNVIAQNNRRTIVIQAMRPRIVDVEIGERVIRLIYLNSEINSNELKIHQVLSEGEWKHTLGLVRCL